MSTSGTARTPPKPDPSEAFDRDRPTAQTARQREVKASHEDQPEARVEARVAGEAKVPLRWGGSFSGFLGEGDLCGALKYFACTGHAPLIVGWRGGEAPTGAGAGLAGGSG